MSRLLAVPTLPGQDLPEPLRHDHDGPELGPLEALMGPFRVSAALMQERFRRRWVR